MENLDPKLVTVFGGAGFVGTQIVQLLAARGHRIRVAVRRPDLAGHAARRASRHSGARGRPDGSRNTAADGPAGP